MEMHQLRYVVAVARAGNFSRAAEQCHVAQPSLSQQIQKLEQELGERLFDRLGRSVKLTAVGVSFLQRATRILEEADAASREARDVQGLVNGKVALGVIPTIAPYLLPGVVAAFARKYPGLGVTVHEETTAQLLRLVNAYEIDFAIASLPIHDDRLVKETLMSEELLLAVPPRHTLAKRRGIATADLESERFILMKEGHCLGDQALQSFNRTSACLVRKSRRSRDWCARAWVSPSFPPWRSTAAKVRGPFIARWVTRGRGGKFAWSGRAAARPACRARPSCACCGPAPAGTRFELVAAAASQQTRPM